MYLFVVFNDRLLDNIEKSKKILYVGMTRARDVLKVTYSVNNSIVEDLIKAKLKIFAEEECSMEVRDMVAATREESSEGKSHGGLFSRIRNLFGI